MLNGNYEKFEWKGQLAFDDSLFSFPAVITCIRHPLWKRCDIHISCSCELNGNYEKFEWKGQLAFDDSLFSFPAVITCIRHPLWKRCDIHISCSCEKYTEHGAETYVKLFSTQVLKTACHANSIEFETSQTRAYVYSANVNHVQSNATLGRTGLHIMHLGDWFSLCRIYNNNMDFGAWGNETDGLFVSENYFHMDIWGATYS